MRGVRNEKQKFETLIRRSQSGSPKKPSLLSPCTVSRTRISRKSFTDGTFQNFWSTANQRNHLRKHRDNLITVFVIVGGTNCGVYISDENNREVLSKRVTNKNFSSGNWINDGFVSRSVYVVSIISYNWQISCES